jgi:hypothetical protein
MNIFAGGPRRVEVVPNMASWVQSHAHYQAYHKRIPDHKHDVEEELRPHHANTLVEFRSKFSNMASWVQIYAHYHPYYKRIPDHEH